jgi:hypothetical protein
MKNLVRRKEWLIIPAMVAFLGLCTPNPANAGGPHISIDLGFLFPFFGAYPVVTPPPPPPRVVVVQPAPEAAYPPPVIVEPAPPPPAYYHEYGPYPYYSRPYPYYSRPYRYYRY